MPFQIVRNDLTRMEVDAIVNPASPDLLGGGGVDRQIHRAAGPALLEACRALNGCERGQAKVTEGYGLPCRYVIHTVGPVWRGGLFGERRILAACYKNSLALALEKGCSTVAFPLLASGTFGYPKEKALEVATSVIREFLETHELTVFLVVYDAESLGVSKKVFSGIRQYIDDAYVAARPESLPNRRLRDTGAMERVDRELPSNAPPDSIPFGSIPFSDAEERRPHHAPRAKTPPPPTAQGPRMEPDGLWEMPGRDELAAYLGRLDEGFREMLLRKIDEKGITDAACYKRANVDRKLFNKIKNQPGYKPGKTTVLAFAVALELPLEETRELLGKAGFSLTHSSKLDLIVEYFIQHRHYDVYDINEALFAFDQSQLGSSL